MLSDEERSSLIDALDHGSAKWIMEQLVIISGLVPESKAAPGGRLAEIYRWLDGGHLAPLAARISLLCRDYGCRPSEALAELGWEPDQVNAGVAESRL